MRQIVLDVETTGLDASAGHRIIEIGCVELAQPPAHRPEIPSLPESGTRDRRGRAGRARHRAARSCSRRRSSPRSRRSCIAFIDGAELIIHNAPFDVGFLDAELARLPGERAASRSCARCSTRWRWRAACIPGQRNSLDALCKRYSVDNTRRELHGALLDAGILVDVYLAMTGGQSALALDVNAAAGAARSRRCAGRRAARARASSWRCRRPTPRSCASTRRCST